MAFVIPNATDTSGGNKYDALDQAEPDAIDFEVLGYGGSGVLRGGEVTSNSSSVNVAVAAGVVILEGIPYALAANATLALPAAPTDNRFDLVVARVSGGTATAVVIQGTNSSTNPSYPKSASVITGAPVAGTNFIPSTDVLLGALYRSGASTVTAARIVDKRVMRTITLFDQGTAAPTGGSTGSLYYRTGAPNGVASGVYIKTSAGDWIELAQNVGAHIPIGGVFIWPTSSPAPSGCLELNGQSLSTSLYSALFAVYGYQHGGSGGTFNLPNLNNKYLRGTTSTVTVSTAVGNDSLTLAIANLPAHTHLHNHTHAFAHTHGIDHDHPSNSTGYNSGTYTASASNADPRMKTGPSSYYAYGFQWNNIVANGGWRTSGAPGVAYIGGSIGDGVPRIGYGGGLDDALWNAERYEIDDFNAHTHTISGGSHQHSYDVAAYAGSTVSQNTSTTGQASFTSTDPTGSGVAIDLRPASQHVRYMVRAFLGSDPAYTGGTSSPATEVGTSLPTSGTINLNMEELNNTYQTIALTGNPTFTTSDIIPGTTVTLFLSAGGSTRTLAWPVAWIPVGAVLPTTLASGKLAAVTVTATSTTDASCVVAYAAQP